MLVFAALPSLIPAGVIDKAKELGLHEFEEKQKAAIGQVGCGAFLFRLC